MLDTSAAPPAPEPAGRVALIRTAEVIRSRGLPTTGPARLALALSNAQIAPEPDPREEQGRTYRTIHPPE
jgi:hypothetical protein